MKKNFNILNAVFDEGFPLFSIKNENKMRTDIKEYDDHYLFDIDVAGISKSDIDIHIEDEYMVVSIKQEENDVKEKEMDDFQYIRKERIVGRSARSYYVGNIMESEIKANYNNGVLSINVPKEKEKKEEKNKIVIE